MHPKDVGAWGNPSGALLARATALALALAAGLPLDRAQAGEAAACCPPAEERPACGCPCPPDPLLRGGCPRDCGEWYVGAGPSALPNVGAYVQFGRVFRSDACGIWAAEARLGWQPWDDKTFADNGQPAAGDWYQAEVGVALRTQPEARRHAVWRAGAMWFQANGEPNWVDTPGDWFGGYVGFGFETDITPSLSIGPSLTLLGGFPSDGDEGFHVTPQVTWGLTWWLGSCRTPTCGGCLPPGELYLDGALSASPGLGGSVGFGQVFRRDARAVWSFEMSATRQTLEADTLFADGPGDFTQLRGGVKGSFAPCGRSHFVLRAGATWFRSTGDFEFVDGAGDYFGAYAGVGWEWDLGRRITTGPEASLAFVTREGQSVDVEVVPQLAWHVIWKL
jgi:hypothetical protein